MQKEGSMFLLGKWTIHGMRSSKIWEIPDMRIGFSEGWKGLNKLQEHKKIFVSLPSMVFSPRQDRRAVYAEPALA